MLVVDCICFKCLLLQLVNLRHMAGLLLLPLYFSLISLTILLWILGAFAIVGIIIGLM
jgi:hypothetical protein